VAPEDAASLAAVERYYVAVNEVIRTGEATSLNAVLAPGFVDHGAGPKFAGDHAGLEQALVARHEIFPGSRIVVDLAAVRGDEVAVRTHVEGESDGAFLGLPLSRETLSWRPLEAFRVDDGMIAERWGDAPPILAAEPLWQDMCPAVVLPPRRTLLALERREVAPGNGLVLGDDSAAHFLFVASGSLVAAATAVNIPGRDEHGRVVVAGPKGVGGQIQPLDVNGVNLPGELTAGDRITIPVGGRLAIRNDGDTPALAIGVAFAAADRIPTELATIARASIEAVIPPGTQVAAGRLTLAPGAPLACAPAPGPVLVLVESGYMEVASGEGTTDAPTWRTLATGSGAGIRTGEDGRWRAGLGEPVVLFVVTVAGIDDDTEIATTVTGIDPLRSGRRRWSEQAISSTPEAPA
jgi:hypothetical protein